MTEQPPERPEGGELPPTLASSGEAADPPAQGDLVGRVLAGRYRILRKLGEGAMGAVYLGEHLKIGRQDAIKVLRDSLATDRDTIARFVRGTRNVSMIRHPNICTIYDYSDTAGGIQFVAMEFVPGETLRDLLQREGRLPLETAVHIARQAAEALDAAHEVGIVHRDLKPANIMIVPGRGGVLDVKVVDFDIAKGSRDGEGEEVTRMGFVVGTPEYMSPEQLIGDRLDGRSDIYSLALVLYRMLTGTLPFAAQDTQDLMVKRLTEEPMALAAGLPGGEFPAALEAAIRRALQRKPTERQATAGEFGREISAAIETPGTVQAGLVAERAGGAPPEAARRPPQGQGRREIPMVAKALSAGGVLILLLVAGVLAFSGDEEPQPAATQTLTEPTQIVEYSDPAAVADPAAEQVDVDDRAPEPDEPASSPPDTAAVTAEPPSTGIATPASPSIEDALYSMFERANAPSAPPASLIAVRDSAELIWRDSSVRLEDRALAAYVAGTALQELGDMTQAVIWLQRAADLVPDYTTYRNALNAAREMLGGD